VDGPVPKIMLAAPVAGMPCVAWARGRVTVRMTELPEAAYPMEVVPVNPGLVDCAQRGRKRQHKDWTWYGMGVGGGGGWAWP
jgi:hypothetical protein